MAGTVIRTLYNFVIGRLKSVYRNYNVLERTEKLMTSEKLHAAPRHPGTAKKFDCLIKERKDVEEQMSKTPTELLNRLKSVRIESADHIQVKSETARELPQKRTAHGVPNFGYEESNATPLGKCSLRQALEFITNNQNEPQKWTNMFIAEKYKMQVEDIENIVKNFKAFQIVFAPEKKKAAAESSFDTLGVNKVKKMLYETNKQTSGNVEDEFSERKK